MNLRSDYLIFRSSLVPKYIGILLIAAGIGYWIDGIAQYTMTNYLDYKEVFEMIVIIPAVIGELALTLYLLIKGIRSNNLTQKMAFS